MLKAAARIKNIDLPHIYEARDYQSDFWDAWYSEGAHEGKNYDIFVLNWHRRAGKDMTCWNAAIEYCAEEPMTCKYAFPTGDMARDNLWEAYTNDGLRFTDFFPEDLRVKQHKGDDGLNSSLKSIEYLTGGSIRVISAHKPGRLRGGNSKLFVLSELQAMDPSVIDIIEPILEANHGRLLVNLTANGDSAAKGLLEAWKQDSRVYVSILTADDTPVFTKETLTRIRERTIKRFEARGQSVEEANAFVDQEYYCKWDSPVVGSYFGSGMRRAQGQGRITVVPYEEKLRVHTFWDLGVDDSMSIWFVQFFNQEVRLIDYFEASGEGFKYYAKVLNGQHEGFEHMGDYLYGKHYAPHDIMVRNMGKDAKTRQDVAKSVGIKFEVVKRVSAKEDGIEAIRSILSRCWWDAKKCKRGINALKGYKKEWNEKLMVYKDSPVHDWTSHGTDAFQTLALVVPKMQPVTQAGVVHSAPPAERLRESFSINNGYTLGAEVNISKAIAESAED
jgi:phage terminase large subunit